MDITRRLLNYYKRWNIEFNQQEQFAMLKNRVLIVTEEVIGEFFIKNDEKFKKYFTYIIAEKDEIESYKESLLIAHSPLSKKAFGSTYVYKAIKVAEDLKRLVKVKVLQVLF